MSHRYDDEFRGPAVADAIGLSECWDDLRLRNLPWPEPDGRRQQISAVLAKYYPPDQLDHSVGEVMKEDAAIARIVQAAKSGALPLWVAPFGEPDRQVATGALLEFRKESILAGCYRPSNDFGWLRGRPLFVKRADWRAFVDGLQAAFGKVAEPDNKLLEDVSEQHFNDAERRKWMSNCGIANGDKAFKIFQQHPRFDGTKQKEWRQEWKEVHARGRGRPKNS